MSRSRLARRRAQRGLDYLETHRLADGGWGYTPHEDASNASLTGWCVLTMRSALTFGFRVDKKALPRALSRIEALTGDDGRCGYRARGESSYRHSAGHGQTFPVELGETLTAISVCCLVEGATDLDEMATMTRAKDLLLKHPPKRRPRKGIDHHYWFFGTLAVYMSGPPHFDRWKKHVERAIVATQRTSGPLAGSWDPVGVWGGDGGRVYSTAIVILTLTKHYRYCRLVR
jgi:hypothetical protein